MTDLPIRILCIDDNAGILADYQKVLRCQAPADELAELESDLFGETKEAATEGPSFQVDTALQGQVGFEMFEKAFTEGNPYQLVFVDMRMPPGWDGLQTMKAIWKHSPSQFIVLCTAYSDYSHADLMREVGHRPNFLIIRKPFQADEILQLATSVALQGRLAEPATDPVTGLPTRSSFVSCLNEISCAENQVLSLLTIDDFSLLAHSLPSDELDALMAQFGALLRKWTEGTEVLVARIAIDQFGLFFTEGKCPQDLKTLLEARIFSCFSSNQSILLTFSEGRVDGSAAGTGEQLMVRAETALRDAARSGRRSTCRYDISLVEKALQDQALEREFSDALLNGELEVYYQPIFSLTEQKFVGAEALLRWLRNGRPVASPDFFIAVAERTGAIVQLGDWVLRSALSAVKDLNECLGRDDFYISVNASNVQLDDPGYAQRVVLYTHFAGVDPKNIGIEVTESRLATNPEVTKGTLEELRENGIKILIDDFGSGFSSLNVLSMMPFDVVKLDRAFIAPICQGEAAKQMVTGVLGLITCLQKTALAEGVETIDQADLLHELGCNLLQGYLYGKPMPLEQLYQLVSEGPVGERQAA